MSLLKSIFVLTVTFLFAAFANTAAQTSVVSYSFDATAEGWTVTTATNGNWLRGTAILDAGSDGSYWHTDASPYSNNAVLQAQSPTIVTTGFTELVLSFDLRYEVESGYDGLTIQYSIAGGAWTDLGAKGDGYNWYNDFVDGLGTEGWSGNNSSWKTSTINLSTAFDNQNDVRFRINFHTDVGITDIGVAFDNFEILSGGVEIFVSGNGIEIISGDTSPTQTDDTDFRSTDVTSGFKIKEYTILNTAGATLNLTGPNPVSISGTDAASFIVDVQPALTLAGGASTTFSIKFDPSTTGNKTAQISIANDDANEAPYTFDVAGNGVTAIYSHNFNAGADGWTDVSGGADNWTRGTALLSSGADGTYWHTAPAAGYNDNATLLIQSPQLNLTGTELVFYLDVRYDVETDWDGFQIEYSDNGGAYTVLGTVGGGIDWYNDTDIDAITGVTPGWSGDNTAWSTVEILLPVALENNANVQFQIRFQSDGFATSDLGVAFDNFMISAGIPDIFVTGNDIEIINGEASVNNIVGTDFRNVDITSGTRSKSFVIQNIGGGTLNLTGASSVTLSGTNAVDFTVTTQPSPTALGFLATSTLTIQFNPSATGNRTATVSIASDDADDDPFTFTISGTGDNALFFHDFNTSNNGWALEAGNANGSWLWGNAIHATGADGTYWHTDASPYLVNAAMNVVSPIFDLTGQDKLSLNFDIRYTTEATFDGFQIEYSSDGGANWANLGKYLDDLNWYNDSDVNAFATAEDGWSGDNATWQSAEIDLPIVLENNANVQFRVLFASDAGTNDVGVAFDNFAIYGGVIPLPVELLTFDGESDGNRIQLSWQTASETNNDYFEVQRSSDGKTFETIGTIAGNGTINKITNYSFIDKRPLTAVNYYRLKQVDFDGQMEIHFMISVLNESFLLFSVVLLPNPSASKDLFEFLLNTSDSDSPFSVQLVSVSGKVYFNDLVVPSQNSKVSLQPNTLLSKGIYILSVVQGNQRSVSKLIIK